MATNTFGTNTQTRPATNPLWNDAGNALSGQGPSGWSGSVGPTPSWNPSIPQAQPSTQQYGATQWFSGGGGHGDWGAISPHNFGSGSQRDQFGAYYGYATPLMQLQQGANQFAVEANQARDQFNWGQQTDIFGMDLAAQQQQMAEWQAQQAANQWQQQHGWDREQFGQTHGLAQQQLAQQGQQFGQQHALAQAEQQLNREVQMGRLSVEQAQQQLSELQNQQQFGLAQQQFGFQQQQHQDTFGLAQQQQMLDQQFREGQLSNDQYRAATDRLAQQAQASYQQGQLGLGQAGIDVQREQIQMQGGQFQQQHQLAQQQQELDRLLGMGMLDVNTYNAETQRLQAEGTLGLGHAQLGEQGRQFDQGLGWEQQRFGQQFDFERDRFGQEFGLAQQTQSALEQYRQQQLQQEAQLARERMEADMRQATMQTFGRQQRPEARFVRSF